MATSDPSTEPTRIDIFQTLAAELQTHRSGVHGDKMAQNLLCFEKGRDLLAVGPDARRAMYYELVSQSIVAVQFDMHFMYRGKQEYSSESRTTPKRGSRQMRVSSFGSSQGF